MQVTRIHDVHCALPLGDADEPDELAGARGADREHQDGAARRVHGRPPLPPSHDDNEWGAGPSTRVGKLVLVDLAGYERFALTGITTGIAAEEAKKINASLLALGGVVNSLADKQKHVPYRALGPAEWQQRRPLKRTHTDAPA